MSKHTQPTKDIFSVSKKNVEKFFDSVEKSSPEYLDSAMKLQKDYINAWKTVINSAISLEQEYATKAGLNVDVPESTLKTFRDITELSMQAYEAQNKIKVDAAEATKKAFEAFNENTKLFASFNRDIVGYIMSVFQQKSKQ